MTAPRIPAAGGQSAEVPADVLIRDPQAADSLAPELSQRTEIWRRFRKNKLAVAGLAIIVIEVLAAVLAPVITFIDYKSIEFEGKLAPSAAHWFGTDPLGRDVYTRVVYGSRISLQVGLASVTLALVMGLAAGAVAGFYGGKLDGFLMRITDVFLAFPYILAAIVLITVIGRSLWTVIIVLGALGWMPFARLFRGSILQIKELEYIEAARAAGCGDWRIITRHILPNAIQPIIVYATIFVGTAVLSEAALSFLGVGVTEPTPAWGLMIAQGRAYLFTAPGLLFFPGAAIFITVMAFVFMGDGLRDALDPRLR
ncbi:MAG: peptide/nickel transport system permease protein [Actinomycetota bacterium]|jgi:ABC-type dipeptide/oligopeptide/nickel transport system permease subunit